MTVFLFLFPWLFGFFVFLLGPILASLFLSFTIFDGLNTPRFVGLANYSYMLSDPTFWASLKVTLIFACITLPLNTAISVLLAFLLSKNRLANNFFKAALYIPSVIPIVASSVLWTWIFKSNKEILWLGDPHWALPALMLISIWSLGNPMIIYLAGLENIPQSLYEAAEIDGASSLQKFFYLTLPLLMPTILFNVTIGIIQVFQYFVPAFVMTSGGPQNATMFYSLYTYQLAFEDFRFGYASALAWVLFLIVLIATLLIYRRKV